MAIDTGVAYPHLGMEWNDRSVLEAASWRLASELVRRHPDTTRLIRAHPGGGQSDCLWLVASRQAVEVGVTFGVRCRG